MGSSNPLETVANVATGGLYGAATNAARGDYGAAAGSYMGGALGAGIEATGAGNPFVDLGRGLAGDLMATDKQRSTNRSGIDLAAASDLEKQGRAAIGSQFSQLQDFTGLGPGSSDVSGGYQAQLDLGSMLKNYASGGFLPSQADYAQGQSQAAMAFKPQQVMADQEFQQAQIRANQLSAQLGRPANDPIIQSKLAQERMQSQERLGANQSAYGAQIAQSMPGQRLGFTQQYTDVKSGLASQAMANRQALLSLGSGIQESERGFRLQTGQQWGNQSQESGGGLKSLLTMAAGLGSTAMSAYTGFSGARTAAQNANTFAQQGFAAAPPPMQASFAAPPPMAMPQMAAPSYSTYSGPPMANYGAQQPQGFGQNASYYSQFSPFAARR